MNAVLCSPCRGKHREPPERGKRARAQGRERALPPEAVYWKDLVRRACDPAGGLRSLPQPERTYYAVGYLVAEVHNGGFDQFFSYSSGALYALALDGLFEMDASASAALLVRAKEVLFGDGYVPLDRNLRLLAMPTTDHPDAPEWDLLEALDKAFWNDPDGLGERCREFALVHRLYPQG